MTYYSEILKEAAYNYYKAHELKKHDPVVGESHQPSFVHPYDLLLDNQTDDSLISEAARDRKYRLIQNRPIVAIFSAEFLAYFHAAADGFNVESEAADIERCLWYGGLTGFDIRDTWNVMVSKPFRYEEYLEFTLAVGNLSSIYQMCYETVDQQVYDFYLYAKEFEKFTNYLLNLVPNLLSYAFLLS